MSEFKLDYIGIGANKAGTSWLNKMLQAHPQICTAEPKEAHFFHDQVSFLQKFHQGNYVKGLDWYKLFFRHCGVSAIKGEITPQYLIDPVVPGRIKQAFPDIKLLLCMRNPVERAASQYYMEKYFVRRESRPISRAIREQPEYVEHGRYYTGLQRFLEHFPLSKFHFVWFDDIARDPEKVMQDVYAFLEVDSSFVPPGIHRKSNAAKRAKWKWIRDMVAFTERKLTEYGLSYVLKLLKTLRVNDAIAWINSRNITYEKLKDEDKAWVLDQLRDDILNLQALTGRDLSQWLK